MFDIYWEYAGTRYNQKFQAIDASKGDVNNIVVKLAEDPFKNFNWSIEPAQSLHYLIKERAFQIRDKFSYIKLYFSGGTDSTTMLNAFVQNNIPIEEIVMYRMSMVDDFKCLGNIEINNFCIPYIDSIKNMIPNTKINVIDIGSSHFNTILNDSFFYKLNSTDLRDLYLPRIRGKNFCHLFGDTEPRLEFKDGLWYDIQLDTANYLEYRFRNIELFYTSSDLPALHAKQAHMMKNYAKSYYSDYSKVDSFFIKKQAVRDTAVAPVPNFLTKTVQDVTSFVSPKTKIMLKNATFEQKQRFYALLASKFNNSSIKKYRGYEVARLNLGE